MMFEKEVRTYDMISKPGKFAFWGGGTFCVGVGKYYHGSMKVIPLAH